jgi:hypothetical protein
MELIEKDLYKFSPNDIELLRKYYNIPSNLSEQDIIKGIAELTSINVFIKNNVILYSCNLHLRFNDYEAICISNNQFSTWPTIIYKEKTYRIIPIESENNIKKLVFDDFNKVNNDFRAVMIHKTTIYEFYLFLNSVGSTQEFKKYIHSLLQTISTPVLFNYILTYHPDIVDLIYSRIDIQHTPFYSLIYNEFDSYQDTVHCLLYIDECMPNTFSQEQCINHLTNDVLKEFISNAKIEHMERFVQSIFTLTYL